MNQIRRVIGQGAQEWRAWKFWLSAWAIGLSLLWCLAISGCSPSFWRKQADTQTYDVLDEKIHNAKVRLGDIGIVPPPSSRMYDPFHPDKPPMPPDDPKSAELMHYVDGHRGYRHWDKNGFTKRVESESYLAYLPTNEEGTLVLDLEGSVLVARRNSRDYQSNLEDLYLSALDVTFERFLFDTQFNITEVTELAFLGRDAPGAGGESRSLKTSTTDLVASRAFVTGAELVVGLANTLMWQFSGQDSYSALSILNFTFFQPLLQGAGKPVNLERLTLAERTVLANVRQFERFRNGFYIDIVAGAGNVSGPSRRGGVFGGAGLSGFSGVGAGGFGRVGGSFGGAGGTGAGQASGFLGLLQNQQQIRNQQANLAALRENLEQIEAAFEAGRIERIQVEQTRQAFYDAESRLLSSQVAYRDALDEYKLELGLPPELEVELDEAFIKPFELLSPRIAALQAQWRILLQEFRTNPPQTPEEVQAAFGAISQGLDQVLEELKRAEEDYQALLDARPRRVEALETVMELPAFTNVEFDASVFDADELDRRIELLEQALGRVRQAITVNVELLTQMIRAAEKEPRPELVESALDPLGELANQIVFLSLVQARARVETIVLEPVSVEEQQAIALARAYRRDWKNARASLVDSWRLIHFNRNALRSGLDLVVSGDIRSTGDRLMNFQGRTGSLQLALQFDAPTTRISERNVYRQALIEYQQSRRGYMRFVDGVIQNLRATLRRIHRDLINFELRRSAVQIAITQVDLTQEQLSRPPRPGEGGVNAQFGATTARDLLSALNDLLSVQNDFLSVFVSYQVQRMILDRDMGTMRLDQRGIWIDPGAFEYGWPKGYHPQEPIPAEIEQLEAELIEAAPSEELPALPEP